MVNIHDVVCSCHVSKPSPSARHNYNKNPGEVVILTNILDDPRIFLNCKPLTTQRGRVAAPALLPIASGKHMEIGRGRYR